MQAVWKKEKSCRGKQNWTRRAAPDPALVAAFLVFVSVHCARSGLDSVSASVVPISPVGIRVSWFSVLSVDSEQQLMSCHVDLSQSPHFPFPRKLLLVSAVVKMRDTGL